MSAESHISSERQLATVKQINALEPIEEADAIELARVGGWDVVVGKGQFKVGDRCVYFELDSILPKSNPEFAIFKGQRLRQRKIRGVYSQGLAMPISILDFVAEIGDDVTHALGVTKWENPLERVSGGSNCIGGSLPPHLNKTGEPRAQNCSNVLTRLANKQTDVVITDKMDGTSTSFYYAPEENGKPAVFYICGHNSIRKPTDSHYALMATKYKVEEVLRKVGKAIAIQGEIVGDKICGNTLGLEKGTVDFLVFYIQDLRSGKKIKYADMLAFCREHGFTPVPERYKGPFKPEWKDVRVLKRWVHTLEYRKGYPQEGIVVATDDNGPRISFKVISDLWLEKWNR